MTKIKKAEKNLEGRMGGKKNKGRNRKKVRKTGKYPRVSLLKGEFTNFDNVILNDAPR